MINKEKKQNGFLANVTEFIGLLLIVFLVRTFGFGLYQVPSGSMETTMLIGERFFADKFTYLIRNPKRGEIIAFNDVTYEYSDNTIKKLFERYVYGPSNITKRIIGVPGDKIKGVVEDGKPIIYVNDVKLNEPYLNKYPLIQLYKEDPVLLAHQINQELQSMLRGRSIDPFIFEALRNQKMAEYISLKSYDPHVSYENQPFYRMKADRAVRGPSGDVELWWPGTISRASSVRVDRGMSHWDGSDDFYVELGADEYWGMGDNRLGSKDCRSFGPIKGQLIHGRIIFRIWSVDSGESWWIVDLIKHPIDFWQRVRWSRFFNLLS
jgi:signal peptidase I